MNATNSKRGGFAYLAALILLVVLGSLGLAMASMTNLELQKGKNLSDANNARLAAESGLSFMLQKLATIRLPGSTTQSTFASALCQQLGAKMNGSENLGGASVYVDAGAVRVPAISYDGGSFTARLTWISDGRCRMTVTGSRDGLTRSLAIDFALVGKQPAAFGFGLASKGSIQIGGSSKLIGVNDPSEASVLSAVGDVTNAIQVSGGATISGDLGVTGNPSSVTISGTPSIAGTTDPSQWAEHIHFALDDPGFPEIDVSTLIPLATNTVTSATNTTSQNLVFNNIRIAAGTNPTFSSDVVINGVVYIESPNVVHFTGKTTLNGFIVTQDSGQPLNQCQVDFSGQVQANGVSALPDTPEFSAVKQNTGTFIVAPGFGVTFSGHVTAMNGNVAADQLTFTGTAEGTIRGSLVCLENNVTRIDGNVEISIDQKNADPNPAGFVKSLALRADGGSYRELPGGG